MATKITNPSVPEEQVSNAEDVQKTSASEAPAAELGFEVSYDGMTLYC